MADAVRFGSLPVSVLTGEQIVRVDAGATLLDAADIMAAAAVGALIVGDGDPPAGIVSERDLVSALAARRDPATTRTGEVAHTKLVWCDGEATVAEVAELMMEQYVRHVLVQEKGQLAGIVSARDLLGAYASEDVDDEEQ